MEGKSPEFADTQSPPGPKQRFDFLDGIRGLAALAVMLYHYTQQNGLHWLPGAWIAVDLFFVLSGFVIAYSYGGKIAGGMEFVAFVKIRLVRLVRLAPLYFLGLILGLIAACAQAVAANNFLPQLSRIATAFIVGAAGLPNIGLFDAAGGGGVAGVIYPLNDPAWSLFFEVLVNVLFFLYVREIGLRGEFSVAALFFIIYMAGTYITRFTNPGWGVENWYMGIPRVIALFATGGAILSARLWVKPIGNAVPTFLLLIVAGSTLLTDAKLAYIASITIVPLLVALASRVIVEAHRMRAACQFLGNISYPLYITHYPLYTLSELVLKRYGLPIRTQLLISAAISIAVAMLAGKVDAWVRSNILQGQKNS